MIDILSTLGEVFGLSLLVSGAYLALAQAVAAATAPDKTDADGEAAVARRQGRARNQPAPLERIYLSSMR